MRSKELKEPATHKTVEIITEILIYFMVFFSVWAFGSTEVWSVWTMNITAYVIGALWIFKLIIRKTTGYSADRKKFNKKVSYCYILTLTIIVTILAYILTSAVNARSSFNVENLEYSYFENYYDFLPHSFDANGTWFLFWQYLGLFIVFIATRDWLSSKNKNSISLNYRLKKLIIVICCNGGLLAFEGILQRIYYGELHGYLLFSIKPTFNPANITQFGPFAYRSNASSYFNLIWPIGVGLVINMYQTNFEHKKKKIGGGPEIFILFLLIIVASAPIISSARGGSLVMLTLLVFIIITTIIFFKKRIFIFSVIAICFMPIGALISLYGLDNILMRVMDFNSGLEGRKQITEIALNMAKEYPIFGSGPNSFQALMQFELTENYSTWESWVHNDYVEFYLTFGKIGSVLIIFLITTFIINYIIRYRVYGCSTIHLFMMFALIGVSLHAVGDFPFQVYSILLIVTLVKSSFYMKISND